MNACQAVKLVRKVRPGTYVAIHEYTVMYSSMGDSEQPKREFSMCIQPAIDGSEAEHFCGKSIQECAEKFQAGIELTMERPAVVDCPADCQCNAIASQNDFDAMRDQLLGGI